MEKKKTRGVFALIMYPESKRVLLSERADGKGWNLPGGRVEDGESDRDALVREVKEETGLDVEVLEQVGEPLVFDNDTAVAYECRVIGGQLTDTNEAKAHRACNAEELKQGSFRVRIRDWGPENEVAMTCGYQDVPLKLIGPTEKLGRTARMVWDALSLMETPLENSYPYDAEEFSGRDLQSMAPEKITFLGTAFYKIDRGLKAYCWQRLDPFSPTGYVQA